jgi:hypothetical protein
MSALVWLFLLLSTLLLLLLSKMLVPVAVRVPVALPVAPVVPITGLPNFTCLKRLVGPTHAYALAKKLLGVAKYARVSCQHRLKK